jgi:type IV secretory pathway TrbL component
MSTLKNIGTKVFGAMIAAGLVAGAAFAADGTTVTVTLPQAVVLGSTTLASGQYTITESSMANGSDVFVFRSGKGDVATAMAMRSANPAVDQKTEVVLTNDHGTLHVDKLFIAGNSAGYQFAN